MIKVSRKARREQARKERLLASIARQTDELVALNFAALLSAKETGR